MTKHQQPKQITMFTAGQDTPLFSGTPQRVILDVFTEREPEPEQLPLPEEPQVICSDESQFNKALWRVVAADNNTYRLERYSQAYSQWILAQLTTGRDHALKLFNQITS